MCCCFHMVCRMRTSRLNKCYGELPESHTSKEAADANILFFFLCFVSVVGRYLQEYTEPQPHPSLGATTLFNESQTFGLGTSDTQNVLLPLTEGCLTSNTGVPIIVVCTKVVMIYHAHIKQVTFFKHSHAFMYILCLVLVVGPHQQLGARKRLPGRDF